MFGKGGDHWLMCGFDRHHWRLPGHKPTGREPVAGGFTLIELLVVITIIGILASMLLPSLSRAKEKARTATCINNLHQMSVALKLYVDDHDDKLPSIRAREPGAGTVKLTRMTLGGFDPLPALLEHFPSARARPLYRYLPPSEVFKCPADKGQRTLPCPLPSLKPSNFETIGCSYQYNAGGLTTLAGGGFRHTPEDTAEGIAEKAESWAPNPVRYILMHEPPARLYGCTTSPPQWYQWHYVQGSSDISDPVTARQEFVSPILFVDGHVAIHDFSKALSIDPYYPYEATREWIWYKPLDSQALDP